MVLASLPLNEPCRLRIYHLFDRSAFATDSGDAVSEASSRPSAVAKAECNRHPHGSSYARASRLDAASRCDLLVSHSQPRRSVKGCNRVHFIWRQLLGDGAHLLVDIVLAHALRKRSQLAFDVGGVLSLQRGRS